MVGFDLHDVELEAKVRGDVEGRRWGGSRGFGGAFGLQPAEFAKGLRCAAFKVSLVAMKPVELLGEAVIEERGG